MRDLEHCAGGRYLGGGVARSFSEELQFGCRLQSFRVGVCP